MLERYWQSGTVVLAVLGVLITYGYKSRRLDDLEIQMQKWQVFEREVFEALADIKWLKETVARIERKLNGGN